MVTDSRSHGLWAETAPPPPDAPALRGDVRVDVAIVGGGYTGLSAALHLAQAGTRAVVLEARSFGFGGAGRNVGLINAGMWVMPDDLPGELGPVHGERLLHLLGDAPQQVMQIIDAHGIACELQRAGTLHCAVGDAGLREIEARATQWAKRGAPVEVLSAEATAARIGTRAYSGALLDRRAGTLQPLAYAHGLAHAAARAGAVLHAGSAVTACERAGGEWRLRTAGGTVRADWVIVATDAYSEGPWRVVRGEQVHLPYFNLATSPLDPALRRQILPGGEGCWDTKEVLSSFRMDAAGRLVFGSVGALRAGGAAVHDAWARRSLRRLFPALGEVRFGHAWYGWIGMTDNALPRLHRFAPNVIGFSGYNGRGIAPGTVFGQVLARHVLGDLPEQEMPLPWTDPRAPSFRLAREFGYEAGAQLVHFTGERF
ncbi:FAD-binding oxidoreductase [Rhodovastum atsumiense]|uniref:FAD-binding oxidoreductase n=2 Tax=Rhodovastum atsumiense TaxID=504468 RepID=A0A5M6J0S9_9PROT|nr:FAD-binding oxidoreductase [Rhodovastum atsumiense]